MSMRRSRIKPAINLAASRRSTAAKSKPGATSSNSSSGGTNSNQKAKPPSKKAQEEKPTKKEPIKKQQPKEAKRPDLDTKDDKEKTKDAELNSSKEGQSRAVDGALKEVITDLAKDGVPEERDAVQSTSVGQKIDDDILVNAEQESLPTEIFDTSTTDEGSNKSSNPVRRKRITAVPNFSQRRAPVTSSKSSLVAKSRPATTRKESEVSPGSLTVTDQKEKKKENNIAAADVIIDGPSDTKENKKTVEPPVVQRKILGKALSTAQKHGNPENKDQSTQMVIERDKLQSASARKDAPILDPIIDKAVNGLLSATTEGPQEGMRHGNIYKKRLEEMNALKKEEAPFNRRKRFIQHPKDGIDTSKMKMKDLIYFNPKKNRMRSQGANDMEKGSAIAKQVNGLSTPRRGEGNMESSEETTVAAAPQVKIGPDGNVILDEQSLVKMVTPKRRLDESEITEVKEDSSSTTYSSFRKSKYSAAWSAGETNRFYNALSTVGTDFSMINAIFPNRKRRELKNKFKREERRNGALVEKALRETKTFDFSNFKNMEEDDNVADSQRVSGETKTVTKPSKKRKKKKTEDPEDSYVAPRSRKADNNNQEDDNDDEPIEIVEDALPSPTDMELTSAIIPENEQTKKDALESLQNPFASTKVLFAKAEERKSSGEEDEFDMESILGKPTRSGRQPKQREVFTIQDTLSQPRVIRPSAEKDNAHHTKGKTGKRKKKMKHKKSKKCHPYRHTIPGIGTSGAVPVASTSEISQETTASRVPPLHPELSECSPQGPFGMDSSLQLPSSMQDQHPTNSPSYRTEHYLVTYPDGTKTLIQMPVSVESDKSFEFVLNVLPSPYREGTTLQLGVIPKNGNFSPHTPVQPLAGGMNIPVSTPGQGIPVTQVITPGSTMGNLAMGSLSQLRLGTSPLVSVPGPSASFSPGLAASSSRYDWSWSLPQSNPLRKTGMSALSPSNFVSHSRASPGMTTASGNKYSGIPSVLLTSDSRALPRSSALNKPSGQLLSGEITPNLSLTTSLYQTSTTDSIRTSGQLSAESVGQPSDGSASQFSKMSSSRQFSPGNSLPSFRSGLDRITSNFEEESSRPPIQILSSQSQPSQDRLFVSQNVIDAKEVASSSFNLTDSNSHEISIRMQNNPSKGIHQPERFVEILSSNGQLVVGDNQVTDNSNIETEVVYVSGLVDPLPAGSEISDPIIAQHVDVSSSVQHDDSQATESEAFVPV